MTQQEHTEKLESICREMKELTKIYYAGMSKEHSPTRPFYGDSGAMFFIIEISVLNEIHKKAWARINKEIEILKQHSSYECVYN